MISRFILMFNGFMSVFFSDWAAKYPSMAYRGILDKKLKEREKLLAAAGDVRGSRKERNNDLTAAQSQLTDITRRLAGAMRTGDVKLGGLLLQKKAVFEKQVADLIPQVEQLDKAVENITHDIKRFNSQIVALQQEAVVNTARMKSAEAQAKIMDMLSGLSVDEDDKMLQDLRQRIESQVAQVEIRQEIDEVGNIDRQIQRAESAADVSGFEAEFEAMMKQQQAAQDTHAAQTPPADGGGKQV